MTIDRSIHLNLSMPDPGAAGADAQGSRGMGQARQEADPQARDNFRKALAGEPADAKAGKAEGEGEAPAPFALFGSLRAPAAPPEPSEVFAQLDELLSGLMVGEGGGGGKQVRMTLAEDVLPGVTVVIEEAQGRVCVDFICAVEPSRLRLNGELPARAPEMAARLARDVLLRTCTDDEEDPCLFEVLACA